MPLSRFFAPLLILAVSSSAFAADWKPAPAPLMTKWGKKVTPENAWQEYPRPQLVRKDWLNLNGLWDYAITAQGAEKPKKWDGQILVPFAIESALSGVGKTITSKQVLWYSRTFELPAGWKEKRVLLHFEAVDWQTTVFVNGKQMSLLGEKDADEHLGGSDPFSFDVTDALKVGKNDLVVRVWDPTEGAAQPRGKQVSKPGGIWYTSVSGIWQTVWLEPVPEAWITGIRVSTDIEKGEVTVSVEANGKLDGIYGMVELVDIPFSDGFGSQSKAVDLGKSVTFKLDARKLKLWSPESPHLYKMNAQLWKQLKPFDFVSSYYAMRKISAAKDDKGVMRLMLNNKPLFQIGPLDQGWWPDGLLTPPSDEAMKYDLEVLKKLGFNMLRKHIKVEPSRYYYHCDKLGLLVWQDMPSGGVPARGQFIAPNAAEDAKFTDGEKKQFRKELKAMIDHLRHFPCIVTWVPFNEGWGQHDTNDILKWVKEYDPTRLVNGPSGWADRGFGDMKDAHIYPGPGMFPVMPDRVSVLGEFGGLGLPLKGHLWKETDNWGYRTFKTTEELRDNYRLLVRRLHPLIGKGLCAAVYTQTTDVEVEVNGVMTYDREVIKLDVEETAKWHKALFGPPPEVRELLPTSEKTGQKWRYTTKEPVKGWEKADYDDAKWTEAEGGFGTQGTPGAVVRTKWDSADIWIRRSFELKDVPTGDIVLRMHHDEDATVYINGVLAVKTTGYTTDYQEFFLSAEGRKALKKGANVIAIHTHQTTGGQYIDAGLIEVVEKK
jgi:hypothetical protein